MFRPVQKKKNETGPERAKALLRTARRGLLHRDRRRAGGARGRGVGAVFGERRCLWPLPSYRGPGRDARAVQKVRHEILPHRADGGRRDRRGRKGRADVPHHDRAHQRQTGAGEVKTKNAKKETTYVVSFSFGGDCWTRTSWLYLAA